MLCGCSAQKRDLTAPLRETPGYGCRVTARTRDKTYEFTFEKEEETYRVSLSEPLALSGFTVTLEEGEYRIGYKDIEFKTGTLPAPVETVLGPLFLMVDAAAGQAGEQDGEGLWSFTVAGKEYTCRFHGQTGVPLSLRVGDEYQLEFADFTYRGKD